DVYIDWQDSEMPETPNKETASRIKKKIERVNWFIFLATSNSTTSRWCPWEIGFADAAKGADKILIVPTEEDSGQWYGNEYLQLYKSIREGTDKFTNRSGVAVFEPGASNGVWISSL